MKEEKVIFESQGNKLVGLLNIPKNPRAAIILCHGLKSGLYEYGLFPMLARNLYERGFAVLRFNFAGHWPSEGSIWNIRLSSQVKDLEAAVKLIKSKIAVKKVGLLGFSFGASTSIMYALRHTVDALVLLASAIDFTGLIKNKVDYDSRKYLLLKPLLGRIGRETVEDVQNINLSKYAKGIKCPTLAIHGEADSIVSWKGIWSFFNNLIVEKQLAVLKWVGHRLMLIIPSIKQKVVNWSVKWFERWL